MIDASKGFIKDGNKNRLRAQDIHKIVDIFNNQTEVDKYSHLIPISEISDSKNDFNLNIPRYIDSSEPEDLQDISAHLNGGIPDYDIEALDAYWKTMPNLRNSLFKKSARKGYSDQLVKTSEVKLTIFEHPEFKDYNQTVHKTFTKWRDTNLELLNKFKVGNKPREVIGILAESILTSFAKAPLIDAYDIYQHLMDYWALTMQDDLYLISQDGWVGVIDKKPNIELIPTNLIVKRFFEKESKALGDLQAECDAFTRQMEELAEEHGGEDGLLNEAKNDKGKITKATVKTRLVEIKANKDAADEKKLLEQFLELSEKETTANKKIKDAQKDLDEKVASQYLKIKEPEIKGMVINFKWLVAIEISIQLELDRVSETLGNRIKTLTERYESPLWQMENEFELLSTKVNKNLKEMGFECR
jgi:type I restriction enzyme M protein